MRGKRIAVPGGGLFGVPVRVLEVVAVTHPGIVVLFLVVVGVVARVRGTSGHGGGGEWESLFLVFSTLVLQLNLRKF